MITRPFKAAIRQSQSQPGRDLVPHSIGGTVGTVGTGSITSVVITVVLPSANVCVSVTGEGDMLNPGVFVSTVVVEEVVLLARLNVVGEALMLLVDPPVLLTELNVVLLTLVMAVGAEVCVVSEMLTAGCEPVSVVVMDGLVLVASTSSALTVTSEVLVCVIEGAAELALDGGSDVVEVLEAGPIVGSTVDTLVDEDVPITYPHIFQQRQLTAFLSNPIVLRSPLPGYTSGSERVPVQLTSL